MKLLKNILYKVPIESLAGTTNVAITKISFDSNNCIKDSLFIAIKGDLHDGHKFINSSISFGATAIMCEDLPEKLAPDVTYIQVLDTRESLGIVSANFFDNPSKKIKLIGVTGTNGKTTITTLLFELFKSLQIKVGLISTIENKINNRIIPSNATTPDSWKINELLNEMVSEGCALCFIEVSSHGIKQKRILGLKFFCGVFTNISRDHLDYHKDFDDYILTKKIFFDLLEKDSFAIINKDDKYAETMLLNCVAQKVFYSLKQDVTTHQARVLDNNLDGLVLEIDGQQVKTKISGIFNAYNLLAIYSVAMRIEKNKINVLVALGELKSVLGRFNIIKSASGINAIIDYAHSPGAIATIFESISNMKTENQKIITVVGCGGNRDIGKRPMMGNISYENSDVTIFTSDNPRDEDAGEIINQMSFKIQKNKTKQLLRIEDRQKAIEQAVVLAKKGDIVLILGKGHEKYQEIKGKKIPFDDYQVLTKILE